MLGAEHLRLARPGTGSEHQHCEREKQALADLYGKHFDPYVNAPVRPQYDDGDSRKERQDAVTDSATYLRNNFHRAPWLVIPVMEGRVPEKLPVFAQASMWGSLLPAFWPGQTIGKKLFKLQVAELTGKPMTVMRCLKRYGGYAAGMATGGLGFTQLLWDPNRQAIQDRAAHTVVVDLRAPPDAAA